jgi:hypothetical protein
MPCCEVCAGQPDGQLSHFTSMNAAFAEFSTRICITIHTKSKLLRNLAHGTSPQDYVSRQTHFSFRWHHLARPLAWPCSNRLLPLGLHYKQVIRNTSCQYWWPKTMNSGVYSKNPQRNATMCYDSLFIATAGVYWMTWWSPLKCHIQTITTEMNSQGHRTHPIGLIKFFHFSLKCYFI